HLNFMVWGFSVLPSEVKVEDPAGLARTLGAASVGTYAWVHHYDPNAAGFPHGSYAEAARVNAAAWDELAGRFPVPYQPNVSMGWDPSPRTCATDRFEARGYPWTSVLEGNSPAAFEDALTKAKAFLERQ